VQKVKISLYEKNIAFETEMVIEGMRTGAIRFSEEIS
jgi:hypothetical protein